MKFIHRFLAISIFLISFFATNAQVQTSSRQRLFSRYSDRLPTKVNELDKAFFAAPGSEIELNFSNFSFKGIVTSSIKRYHNLSTVIIKSTSLNNSLLSISKKINDDKTISYIGRIINENYADGYELVQDSLGNYSLNKIKTEALLQDF
jgi:hypothetical protein